MTIVRPHHSFRYLDVQQELEDFTEGSRQLEAELETSLEQREKTIKDLKMALNQLQNDNESLRVCVVFLDNFCFKQNAKQYVYNCNVSGFGSFLCFVYRNDWETTIRTTRNWNINIQLSARKKIDLNHILGNWNK